jgi:hypothetical protein
VAAGTIWVTTEDGKTNLADVLTKLLPQATKEFLCDGFMYWWWLRLIVLHVTILVTSWACFYMWPNFIQVLSRTSRRCFVSILFEGTK